MKRLLVLAAACSVLVACGATPLYSLDKTKACLTEKNVRLEAPRDFVASSATGGATRAVLQGNAVTIVFGAKLSDAEGIADEYRRVAAANVGIDDVLHQQRNAVMLWHLHPGDSQQKLILACLK